MSVSASGDYGVMAAAGSGEIVTLHGTLAVPILKTFSTPFGFPANVTWIFSPKDQAFNSIERGQVQKAGFTSGILLFTSVNIDTDWVQPNDFQNGPYFIRAQLEAGGDQPFVATVGLPLSVIGTADNPADWFTLTNGGAFAEYRRRALAFPDMEFGTIKVDISSSASEAGILATGFYRAEVDVESP